MTNLFDLPDELVAGVLSYLTKDKPALRNLSYTCRNASMLVRPVLFHDIGDISPNLFDQAFREMSKFNLIRSSLEERPSLGPLVRSARIRWTTRSPSIHKRANTFLEKLSGLRSLELEIGSGGLPFEPVFLEQNKMELLNSLTISDSMLTLASLKNFIWLGQFRSLNVLCIKKLDESDLPTAQNSGTAEVSRLHLCRAQHLPDEIFDNLLNTFTGVEFLECMIPGSCSQGIVSRRVPSVMLNELSPSRVLQALEGSRQSLKEMTIQCSPARWPSHDGSRLDLTGFQCLQKVCVASRLLFQDPTPRTPAEASRTREGLFKLLPSSLKELSVFSCLDTHMETAY
ncbi:hypothetical protein BP5796_00076 [Coleophoma crateriformis]|uniref:F-box domain-containing protein n=1 Tax=Coleophoma crateriformis TaxID=565419 RepID=A0A3D8T6Y3_9HELO|nr:hypothetical protein BP5796_00076 [Coleophoma crateriformis]